VTAALVVAGCDDEIPPARTVELTGEIRLPAEARAGGAVSVGLYHAWAGSGELRHAVQFIESFQAAPGAFSHRFQYPFETGEGLLVYAWVDLDRDAVLCTPAYRLDLAGLTEVTDFPADRVHATVELTAPCRGPDWFYPRPAVERPAAVPR
jgi:hypothetical protein